MKQFISDLNSRIEEINEYFSFVEFIDEVETYKKEKLWNGESRHYTPRRDLQKILRSNCFLLLYNLIESSIRNAILSVYDCVHDDSLKYEDLSDRIKEIWLTHQSQKSKASEKNLKIWLKSLIKDISEESHISLEKETINISGNLDYDSIQKIIDTYGFYGKITLDKKEIGYALNIVKRERNLLAHGNKTFCQSGEIITMKELTIIKDNISRFLTEVLLNVELYIDNKKYKK
jgi:hypothetical protein